MVTTQGINIDYKVKEASLKAKAPWTDSDFLWVPIPTATETEPRGPKH
jgi:hypothetical protein